MALRKLHSVLKDFARAVLDCRRLAADAHIWSLPGNNKSRPYISSKRRESLTELAFLRAFLAWEGFLEETFILYLLGVQPPRGRGPHRNVLFPSKKSAMEWVIPEGRRFARWCVAWEVRNRAVRFFRDGTPFASTLSANQNLLEEARKIRNACAHELSSTRQDFEKLARIRLKQALPRNLTVGVFLSTTMPQSKPPLSFFEFYVQKLESAAKQIVPTP